MLSVWYAADEVPASLNPMPTTVPGFMTRAEALERYGEMTGRDISGFDWYLVFGTWKVAVVCSRCISGGCEGKPRTRGSHEPERERPDCLN